MGIQVFLSDKRHTGKCTFLALFTPAFLNVGKVGLQLNGDRQTDRELDK